MGLFASKAPLLGFGLWLSGAVTHSNLSSPGCSPVLTRDSPFFWFTVTLRSLFQSNMFPKSQGETRFWLTLTMEVLLSGNSDQWIWMVSTSDWECIMKVIKLLCLTTLSLLFCFSPIFCLPKSPESELWNGAPKGKIKTNCKIKQSLNFPFF